MGKMKKMAKGRLGGCNYDLEDGACPIKCRNYWSVDSKQALVNNSK